MRTYKQWIIDRQINAEFSVMFALVERIGWTHVLDVMASISISPWRFTGAINRLVLAKKVQVVLAPDGESHMYALTPTGREFLHQALEART